MLDIEAMWQDWLTAWETKPLQMLVLWTVCSTAGLVLVQQLLGRLRRRGAHARASRRLLAQNTLLLWYKADLIAGATCQRSTARLWLDGMTLEGFNACVELGWSQYGGLLDGERLGSITPKGYKEMRDLLPRYQERKSA